MGLLIVTSATPTTLSGVDRLGVELREAGHHAVVDQLGDRVGEPVEALLELRALQGEENVEHMLRGVRVADRQVGLQEVDPGRGPVAHARRSGGPRAR